MAKINEMILSEINNVQGCSKETKDFLKWLIEFERENSEREQFAYKAEIEKAVERILVKNTSEDSKDAKDK